MIGWFELFVCVVKIVSRKKKHDNLEGWLVETFRPGAGKLPNGHRFPLTVAHIGNILGNGATYFFPSN